MFATTSASNKRDNTADVLLYKLAAAAAKAVAVGMASNNPSLA